MNNSTNEPYIKLYSLETGNVINPITAANPYISFDKNRSQRRESKQKDRFHGESKNIHLSVFGEFKYERFKQIFADYNINGTIKKLHKVIFHYKLR